MDGIMDSTGSRRAVFLDRDGVVNKVAVRDGVAYGPRSIGEFEFVDGVTEQVGRLKQAGYLTILISNQPDIARGNMTRAQLNEITDCIRRTIQLDDVFICLHDDGDGCACRKPAPGMLREAAQKHDIDLAQSVFIGDTWKDARAADAAGCRSILVDAAYNQGVPCDVRVASLRAAVDIILADR
jgi:D-glycero-D-manno-heptose 1,7-bisphosphate phosphatase